MDGGRGRPDGAAHGPAPARRDRRGGRGGAPALRDRDEGREGDRAGARGAACVATARASRPTSSRRAPSRRPTRTPARSRSPRVSIRELVARAFGTGRPVGADADGARPRGRGARRARDDDRVISGLQRDGLGGADAREPLSASCADPDGVAGQEGRSRWTRRASRPCASFVAHFAETPLAAPGSYAIIDALRRVRDLDGAVVEATAFPRRFPDSAFVDDALWFLTDTRLVRSSMPRRRPTRRRRCSRRPTASSRRSSCAPTDRRTGRSSRRGAGTPSGASGT